MSTKSVRIFATACAAWVAAIGASGCAVDENPITPEKMQQFRARQQSEREKFNPDMTSKPPASASTGTGG